MKAKILINCIILSSIETFAQGDIINIWQNTKANTRDVSLAFFLPDTNKYNGMAVIVCPGGSYSWHDYDVEGVSVARWLQKEGIAAFVLKYRVQGILEYVTHSRVIFGGHKHPDMIEDLQMAIYYLRKHSKSLCINPNLIGAMGFSAGGHLVMSSACYFHTDFISKYVFADSISLRPDFVAPIYPVVSMSHPDTHKRSRRALLGEWGKSNRVMRDSLSLEKHIPPNCPPVFLVNCKDDPVVKYHNSELLDSALTAKGVLHKYIQYESGGHGFGSSERLGTTECRQWKREFFKWIKQYLIQRK